MICNIPNLFKSVLQYRMAKFNNAKPQLLLHQPKETHSAPSNQLYKKCEENFSKWKRKSHNWKYKNYNNKNCIKKGKHAVKVVLPVIKEIEKLKLKSSIIVHIHNN